MKRYLPCCAKNPFEREVQLQHAMRVALRIYEKSFNLPLREGYERRKHAMRILTEGRDAFRLSEAEKRFITGQWFGPIIKHGQKFVYHYSAVDDIGLPLPGAMPDSIVMLPSP